jgi:hypothetical protein
VPSYRADVSRDVAFFLRRTVTDRAAIEADVAENGMFARLRRAREAEPARPSPRGRAEDEPHEGQHHLSQHLHRARRLGPPVPGSALRVRG